MNTAIWKHWKHNDHPYTTQCCPTCSTSVVIYQQLCQCKYLKAVNKAALVTDLPSANEIKPDNITDEQ